MITRQNSVLFGWMFFAAVAFTFGRDQKTMENRNQHVLQNGHQTVVLGGGCFWCTEAIFKRVRGVLDVQSGYSGGKIANPSYEQVCSGKTGHAEVVRLDFDPKTVSLAQLLEIFFTTHDPTTLNRQGADVGTQYRSVIFYQTPEQKRIAEEVMEKIADEKIWNQPIVTQLEAFRDFYPAEGYHQDYFERNPKQAYCSVVIAPKVAKFRQKYADLLKSE